MRLGFIRIFTPLLVIELKRIDDHEQIIEILKIFETLLTVVDSSARESPPTDKEFVLYSSNARRALGAANHPALQNLPSNIEQRANGYNPVQLHPPMLAELRLDLCR